jgi:hypothetical protein
MFLLNIQYVLRVLPTGSLLLQKKSELMYYATAKIYIKSAAKLTFTKYKHKQ